MPWEKQFDVDAGLERAMREFWAHGYEATSVQDIVDCTGINRGSLYGTYGDKHALFVAALRHYDEKIRHRTLACLEAELGPRAAIRRLFENFADPAAGGRPTRGCFLTNSALELAAHDPEVAAIVARSQEEIEAFLVRMIEKGQRRGEIAADIEARQVARGLLAGLQGLIVLTRSRPDRDLLQAIIDDAMGRLA